MTLSRHARAAPRATAVALAGLAAGPALAQSVGETTETKVGCTSPEPYVEFEEVYAEDGRMAAYKVLSRSNACQVLEQPTNVKLRESVARFDFGWGTGQVWRVTPVNKNVEAPDELFIRIRE
jgi:hypothetical protein